MKKSVLALALLALAAAGNIGCPGLFPVPDDDTKLFEVSAVVRWNEVMLAAVRNGRPRPTVVARSTFIVHTAIYDAWALYDDKATPLHANASLRRPESEHTDANKLKAISFAAYKALLDQFPAYETQTGAFTRLLNDLGFSASSSTDTATPEGIGNIAAQTVLDFRQNDGANEAGNYAQITSTTFPSLYAPVNSADPSASNAPGGATFNRDRWQPLRVPTGELLDADENPIFDSADPTSFTDQSFLTPHWGAVIPFALEAGNQFRPVGPPIAGSSEPYTDSLGRTMTHDQAYNMQVDEVLQISATLTDEQKVIAEFWADGPRSETPPGHWQALAHGISFRDQHSLDDDVKLYFALTGAIFDSSICTWEAKRFYDSIRPISAIRHKYFGQSIQAWGGPNRGTEAIQGEEWLPYQALDFVTPPFGEFSSGHSCFSASAAEVLTEFTGSNQFFDGQTILFDEDFNEDGLPDFLGQHIVGIGGNAFENSPASIIVLKWDTFQEAADEAGISRIYGGIHFLDGDRRARALGTTVGALAFEKARQLWNGE